MGYSWVNSIHTAYGEEDLAPKRVAVVRWLIRKGLILPSCVFAVNECDYATAIVILQHKLDLDGIINGWFRDRAPQAMELVKDFMYSEGEKSTCNPQTVALMCVQRFEQDPLN